MTRPLQITEKVIAGVLIFCGGLIAYTAIAGLRRISEGFVEPVSFIQIFKNFHPLFLFSLLTIVGGVFLFFSKKFGWTLSLTSLLIAGLFFLMPTEKGNSVFIDPALHIFFSLLVFFSLVLCYVLMRPAFITKYNVTRKTWFTIALISILVLLEKLLLYLTS